jgi:hypothetical protein
MGSRPWTPGAWGEWGFLTIVMPGSGSGVFARETNGVLEVANKGFAVLAEEVHHAVRSQGFLGIDMRAAWQQVYAFVIGRNVYSYRITPGRNFSDYRAEQQGQMVRDCYGGSAAACNAKGFPYTPTPVERIPVWSFPKSVISCLSLHGATIGYNVS